VEILVIAERLPSYLGGGAARQFNLIRELSSRHKYSVVTNVYPDDIKYQTDISRYVKRLEIVHQKLPIKENRSRIYWQINAWKHAIFEPYPKRGRIENSSLQESVHLLLKDGEFDIIQVHQAYLASLLPPTRLPKILDMHDILSEYEHQLLFNKSKLTHRFLAWLEWKKMLRYEKKTIHQFDVCVTVSENDRQKLLQIVPDTEAFVVPNGVDINYFKPISKPRNTPIIAFTGSMNYHPNTDAVRWFYKSILPIIWEQYQNFQFNVVGWSPPEDILALDKDPRVTVTGFVEDIRPYLAESDVIVVPLRFGSGTRLKILEAWAMGKAVVSTQLGAEGLQAIHSKNIIISDNPDEFANYILDLLSDRDKLKKLGLAGRKTVEDNYSWSAISNEMEKVYDFCITQRL